MTKSIISNVSHNKTQLNLKASGSIWYEKSYRARGNQEQLKRVKQTISSKGIFLSMHIIAEPLYIIF